MSSEISTPGPFDEFFDPSVADVDPDNVIRTTPSTFDAIAAAMVDAARATFAVRKRMTVTEWAVENRIVPGDKGQPKPGPYDPANSPVMVVPQNAFSDPRVTEITFKIAAQVGKSFGLANMIGWAIDMEPGPITLAYPNESTARKKSKEDFAGLFQWTPVLKKLVHEDDRPKADRSTMMRYSFLGGWMLMVTAKSDTEMASSPAQYFFFDEYARITDTAEGSVDAAGEARQTQFANRKMVKASTCVGGPESCKITESYENGDQSKPFLPCPSCGHAHIMAWQNVHIPRDHRERMDWRKATYECPKCATRIGDGERFAALQRVMWRQTGKFDCCEERHDPMELRNWDDEGLAHCPTCDKHAPVDHRSFWASVLYGMVELKTIAKAWVEAQGKPARLMQFFNQRMAEAWGITGKQEAFGSYDSRRINYSLEFGEGVQVPPWAKALLGFVDVQHDRVEVSIRAFGNGSRSAGVLYRRILGAPTSRSTWEELERIRTRLYRGSGDVAWRVKMLGVDIGDGTTAPSVMTYVRPMKVHGVVPMRGVNAGPLINLNPVNRQRQGYTHFQVSKLTALSMLDTRLRTVEGDGAMIWPVDEIDSETGEVLVNSGYDDQYFEQVGNFILKRPTNPFGKEQAKYVPRDKAIREEAADIESCMIGLERLYLASWEQRLKLDRPPEWEDIEPQCFPYDWAKRQPLAPGPHKTDPEADAPKKAPKRRTKVKAVAKDDGPVLDEAKTDVPKRRSRRRMIAAPPSAGRSNPMSRGR